MKKFWILSLVLLPNLILANDGVGFVATGGVTYLKTNKIAMVSEDLQVGLEQIKVKYEYQNLTSQTVMETILFPLPLVDNDNSQDFANLEGFYASFKVFADGKEIKPKQNLRVFMYPETADHFIDENHPIDVTADFKRCGISDQDIIEDWTRTAKSSVVNSKLAACQNKTLESYIKTSDGYYWAAQMIYSWQQSFAADKITRIEHQYQPLVGGQLDLKSLLTLDKNESEQFRQTYCLEKDLDKKINDMQPFSNLSYILTTGANWAKPIQHFRLSVEYYPQDEIYFCWKGNKPQKINKGNKYFIQVEETNFLPQQDLNLLYVPKLIKK